MLPDKSTPRELYGLLWLEGHRRVGWLGQTVVYSRKKAAKTPDGPSPVDERLAGLLTPREEKAQWEDKPTSVASASEGTTLDVIGGTACL